MVQEVGAYYRVFSDEIMRRPLSWLVATHEQVTKRGFEDQMNAVRAVELGTMRALAQSFGGKGKELPELPTWNEVKQGASDEVLPTWMQAFETVNKKE